MRQRAGTEPDLRVLRCRLRCVVRVNFAGQRGQNLVWGSVGMLPLCERILDTLPFFVRTTEEGVTGLASASP